MNTSVAFYETLLAEQKQIDKDFSADLGILWPEETKLRDEYRLLVERTEASGADPTIDPACRAASRQLQEKQDECVQKIVEAIHGLPAPRKRWALCLSGGGIRSATFALGVLQGLAHHGVLGSFDYLSTVSGGGYIGSWFSAWLKHAADKNADCPEDAASPMDCVSSELQAEPERDSKKKLDPESPPVLWLRMFSNYLTPKLGFLSGDTWALACTVLRNMTLNWLVLLPLLLAVVLIPSICLGVLQNADRYNSSLCFSLALGLALVSLVSLGPFTSVRNILAAIAPPAGILLVHFFLTPSWPSCLLAGALVTGVIGVAYMPFDLPSIGNARLAHGTFIRRCWIPLIVSVVLATLAWWGLHNPSPLWGGVFGAVFFGCGWALGSLLSTGGGTFSRKFLAAIAAAGTGFVGGVLATAVFDSALGDHNLSNYVVFAFPLLLLLYSLAGTLLIGMRSDDMSDDDREWWARAGGWILVAAVSWAVAGAVLVYMPILWYRFTAPVATVGAASWFSVWWGRSAETRAKLAGDGGLAWRELVTRYGAPVLLIVIMTALALAAEMICVRWEPPGSMSPPVRIGLMLGAIAVSTWFSRTVNVNKFSLHGMYRNRLIRAYLGASRTNRNAHPFTGFDADDNLRLSALKQRPLHIINAALNLVSGQRLAWQQRKAMPFTFSPLHCGSVRLGYRPTEQYGGSDGGVSVGTAVAISGAAASPNMGYHSSPLVTLLLALFNGRLGWWLGNPGSRGESSWKMPGPKYSAVPLVKEALGLTDDLYEYVYLSDGGHFENLGIFEMVLRRCHVIVVSDASADPKYTYEDLGAAVRKVRIDLGIPIDFKEFPIRRGEISGPCHCAVGLIRYRCVDGNKAPDGVLIYMKPVLTGAGEPADVRQYAADNPEFPHQTTVDQFFDESQFESYRRLGLYTVQQMLDTVGAENVGSDRAKFLTRVESYAGKSGVAKMEFELDSKGYVRKV